MAEDKPKKPAKMPVTSPLGAQMQQVSESMNKHKSDKSIHECLNKMHAAVGPGAPILKTAYEAGWKYAADSASENSSSDNPAMTGSKDEGEDIIKILRRGWPDQGEKFKRQSQGPDNREEPDSETHSSSYHKKRSQLTKHSPETTV